MTGFTYEYTNGYINSNTEIRLIKIYNDGVYYFKDWVELDGSSSELDWENRANEIMMQVELSMNNNVPTQDQIYDNQEGGLE
jgi:hypothetical protein